MSYRSEKWINRYFELAREVSSWSKDPSTKIGATIIGAQGQVISNGYNGFPRGINDSPERYNDRPLKYKYVVHAENNAIFNAIHNGASTVGASIFVVGIPVCHECAKAIIQCGITHVYVEAISNDRWTESTDLALSMFKEAGIEVYIKQKESEIK